MLYKGICGKIYGMDLSGVSDNVDSLIYEVIETFDFERAALIMSFTNMYWINEEGEKYFPSVNQLKEKAVELLREAASDCIETHVSEIGHGGLKASAFIDVDGVHFSLELVILTTNYPEGCIDRMVPMKLKEKIKRKDIGRFIELAEKIKLLYLLTKYGDIREPETEKPFGGKNIL